MKRPLYYCIAIVFFQQETNSTIYAGRGGIKLKSTFVKLVKSNVQRL